MFSSSKLSEGYCVMEQGLGLVLESICRSLAIFVFYPRTNDILASLEMGSSSNGPLFYIIGFLMQLIGHNNLVDNRVQ